jgi:hypothetical protein
MNAIIAVEAEINAIRRTYRSIKALQCGELSLEQVVMRDSLIEERLELIDKLDSDMRIV